MRDPKRIEEITHALKRLWHQNPDMRLGQLLENFVFPRLVTEKYGSVVYLWAQEDDDTFMKIIQNTNFAHPKASVSSKPTEGPK